MNPVNKTMLACLSLLICGAIQPNRAIALSLRVESYELSKKNYKSIKDEKVYYTADKDWLNKVFQINPDLMTELKFDEVASIEVKPKEFLESWGSIDPFASKGLEEAADLGANLLIPVNITVMKNTDRVAIVTFTADRLEFEGMPLPAEFMGSLATSKWDVQNFKDRVHAWREKEEEEKHPKKKIAPSAGKI